MNREWVVDVVQRLPQGLVSRCWGWLARRRRPRTGVALLKRAFVGATGIDLTEAGTSVSSYSTLEDLFVRTLRPGARRIDPDPTAVVSPVDGTVGACGEVSDGTLFQVKGRSYPLADLLDDAAEAARYEGGAYGTFYLAPHNYHRIHAPLSGDVNEATVIPGGLMPVFPESLEKVDGLFARNERLITYLDTADAGRVAVVKVGATLVGRISVSYDPDVHTNVSGGLRRRLRYDGRGLNKGEHLGTFELGSTVVLVAEAKRLELEGLSLGQSVRMGERIGTVLERSQRRKKSKKKKGPKTSKRKTKKKASARAGAGV